MSKRWLLYKFPVYNKGKMNKQKTQKKLSLLRKDPTKKLKDWRFKLASDFSFKLNLRVYRHTLERKKMIWFNLPLIFRGCKIEIYMLYMHVVHANSQRLFFTFIFHQFSLSTDGFQSTGKGVAALQKEFPKEHAIYNKIATSTFNIQESLFDYRCT